MVSKSIKFAKFFMRRSNLVEEGVGQFQVEKLLSSPQEDPFGRGDKSEFRKNRQVLREKVQFL